MRVTQLFSNILLVNFFETIYIAAVNMDASHFAKGVGELD